MKCPDCGYDNVVGLSVCECCGQDLTAFDETDAYRDELKAVLLSDLDDAGLIDPVCAIVDDSIAAVLERMRAKYRGSVLILENEKLIGIFTERDLIKRLPATAVLENERVGDYMTPDPDTYQLDDSLCLAVNGMAVRGNRHLPVMDGERLVGLLGVRKILAYIAEKADL
tara:strand:+ start:1117 stop:1623 length:507 start_codon:yes stop_codon:yes gene_type:complete